MKRYLLITLLALLLLGLAASVQAEEKKVTTIVPYLDLPGAQDPTAGIPQYIRYIFVFSLGVVGIVAFITMLVAAFGYVTSVGNPQKAAAAKDRIFSALLGMLLLFGSYLLLNTINPDLLRLKITGDKVDIPVSTEEAGGCRATSGAWNKMEIDYGETAIFTIYFSKDCAKGDIVNAMIPGNIKLKLYQRVSGLDTDFSKCCDNPPISYLEDPLRIPSSCHFTNSCENVAGGNFTNQNKEQPEKFYIKGEIKVRDTSKQSIPEAEITMNDLDAHDNCCK